MRVSYGELQMKPAKPLNRMQPAFRTESAAVPQKKRGKPKGSGSQTIFDALRDDILSLKLRPGVDIEEVALAMRYGLSRTPVREALIKLAAEGLVEVIPNRGARVAPLGVADIPALLEASELCERAIHRWAALRRVDADLIAIEQMREAFERVSLVNDYSAMATANSDFHKAIASACGNRFLEEQYRTLSFRTIRLSRMAFSTAIADADDHYYETVRQQHKDITDAIGDRDADAVDGLTKEHANLFRTRMLKFFEQTNAAEIDLSS